MVERRRSLPLRATGESPWMEGIVTSMTNAAPDLSIVVPSYNEEARLPGTLEKNRTIHSRSRGRTQK